MTYIDVGCKLPTDTGNKWAPSKKAMRDALKASAVDVIFECTSQVGSDKWSGRGNEIPVGVTLSVVGPDPYANRKWYASVTRDANGVIKVA